MSSWIYEIALRVIVFVSLFVYGAGIILIGVGIEGETYPEYRAIQILVGVLLVPLAPIATGLLMARLGERTRTCIKIAIVGMFFPFFWLMWSVHRHRATRLLYASRKTDDAGLQAMEELADIIETRELRGVESLIRCARENWDPTIRADAISRVSEIKTPRVLEVLTAGLKDKDWRVRRTAADELGRWQDAQAIAPLEQALNDKNEDVRKAAEAALAKLRSSQQPSISMESLRSPVFQWSGNDFGGPNQAWVDKVRQENETAIAWFDAQGFVRIPTFAGEEGAAEYCFDMASQAQNSGNTQEAWAGFHQALRRYARLQNEKMLGLTCFNLGKVYGLRQDWEMARLMFLQSAYLSNKTGKEDGYAWALFYLGDTSDQLGDKDLAIQFMSEALPIFQRVSPNDVSGIQAAMRRLTESK
jgi:tetratricopeptide (TPR) repeat protein